MYDAVQERMAAYEQEMLRKLGEMEREQHHEQPVPPLAKWLGLYEESAGAEALVATGAEFYETQHRKQQVIHLKRKAAQLGLEIIEVAAAA
jgi:hypothetical protein